MVWRHLSRCPLIRRTSSRALGWDPAKLFLIDTEFELGEDAKRTFQHERIACISSKALADKFGWKPGERITLIGDIFPVTLELTLSGIYSDPDRNEILFFNREYLRESLAANSAQRDTANAFKIQATSPEETLKVAKAIDALFENSPYQTVTESERAFQLSFVSFLGNLKLFLLAICGAVTFTILLVSANTISMSVRERIGEVGIMKTLGFTPSAILGIVLGEAIIMALVGGAVGSGLAEALCAVMRHGPSFVPRSLSVTPLIATLNLVAALLIGLTSALVPAVSAARTSIVDSLRHTG